MMSILPVFAQNSHWEYRNFHSTSAVTVVHSNGTAYLFQSDNSKILVSEINPNNMLPLYVDYDYSISNVVFQGGYEDFYGNIVVYGDINNSPVAVQYDVNTQQILNVAMDNNYSNDSFINGCCGYDINGNVVNVFVLQNRGILVGFDWSGPIFSFEMANSKSEYITDVMWDYTNTCFAATGLRYGTTGPSLFLLNLNYDISSGFIFTNPMLSWTMINPGYSNAEFRPCLELLPNSDIAVGQCVRNSQCDWIWLSTINGYSIVGNSSVFPMPFYKTSMLDMKFNGNLDQLVILGKITHPCGEVNYISQVDPYSLSGMVMAQVRGSMTYTHCLYNQHILLSNDINLQKLEENSHGCLRILATGTYAGNEAYVTEIYDIANSSCDIIDYPLEIQASRAPGNVFGGNNPYNLQFFQGPTLSQQNVIQEFWSCPDITCFKESPKFFLEAYTEKAAVEWIEDGLVEFIGFSGEITYRVYNMMGQCVVTGNAFNGTKRLQFPSNGLYVIKAEDKYGHVTTTKIVQVCK